MRAAMARLFPLLIDPLFADIPVRTLVRWRVVGVIRRGFWRFVGGFLPICPACHQRVDGPIRMTPWGRCEECEERLWDLGGERPW